MRNFLFFSILAVSISCLSSCKYPTEYQQVSAEGMQLSVPPYVKKVSGLRENTPIQYSSKYRNFYVVAWKDEKASRSYSNYYYDAIHVLEQAMISPAIFDSSSVQMADMRKTETQLFGSMKDGEALTTIYYYHLTAEKGDAFYQLCVWTRGQDRFARYKEDMQKVLDSFKLE